MNGRLYDPLVGRFLSADPYVQADGQTQAYNRYSYCLNNPLRYIDPSGYRTVLGRFFHWVGENAGTIGTVAYLAGAAVTTVFCPPAGLAMFGAYLGGAQANNWELNAGSWNRSDPMTYMGIGIGALTGYVAGYGLVHPGTVALRFGPSIAGVGEIGLSISNNNWQLSWTTSAGGGGNYNLNGRNTSAEQIGERAVADARTNYVMTPSGTRLDLVPYTGPKYIGGIAPSPGFPKGIKIIQYGGHTLEKGALKALNLTKEEGKFAIESMKRANGLPPDFHGNIGVDGSFWSKTWEYIDNILDYLY